MPEKGNGAEDTAGRDGLGEGEDVGNRMVECVDDIDGELVCAGGKRDFVGIPQVNDGVGEAVG